MNSERNSLKHLHCDDKNILIYTENNWDEHFAKNVRSECDGQ